MFGIFTRRPWAIHNPLKSWTLAGLSLRECQLLVASMTDAEMKVSWAHHKGWNNWKPLGSDECHDLFIFKDSDQHALPALPEMHQDDDHEITEVRPSSAPAKTREQITRRHRRYVAHLPVQVILGAQHFSTHTLDLSAGGFCFEDKLPDWVAGYFTVEIKVAERQFELTCFLAEDQKKDKFRAEISPTTAEKVLQGYCEWLESQNYPEAPKKMKA